MKIKLHKIAIARSGDKGRHSNVGIIFKNKNIYQWAVKNITTDVVKSHFKSVVRGDVLRYELPNILALNFILKDSLGGGGSESLINDAQGKTHGQAILMMELNIDKNILER
tara:strand:+ start:675 stop:1007 length:333 start_codon:yes stop_codon:yes gene_type:complete